MGEELLHVDGRTDQTDLIVAFHNFANGANKDITTANFLRGKLEIVTVGYKTRFDR